MKKFLCAFSMVFVLGCDVSDGNESRSVDVSVVDSEAIEYIVMPEVVIVARPEVQKQEIIFTEEEVDDTFEDPTAYGAETFSAVYVPSN